MIFDRTAEIRSCRCHRNPSVHKMGPHSYGGRGGGSRKYKNSQLNRVRESSDVFFFFFGEMNLKIRSYQNPFGLVTLRCWSPVIFYFLFFNFPAVGLKKIKFNIQHNTTSPFSSSFLSSHTNGVSYGISLFLPREL